MQWQLSTFLIVALSEFSNQWKGKPLNNKRCGHSKHKTYRCNAGSFLYIAGHYPMQCRIGSVVERVHRHQQGIRYARINNFPLLADIGGGKCQNKKEAEGNGSP